MSDNYTDLPKENQTILGLYVTAKESHERWQADPDHVKIVDVRTPEEFLFVGHPPMAWLIPLVAQSYVWDATKGQYPMTPLPDFISRVRQIAKPDDTLLVTCRSGGRGAMAVNALAQAGFKNVYNIIDGIEGDGNGDSDSTPAGGWKNSGCPWTKKLTPERMLLPKEG